MTQANGANAVTRRTVLRTFGAVIIGPAITAPVMASRTSNGQHFIRALGQPDLALSGPAFVWSDFDTDSVCVSLLSTGRPVRVSASVPLEYGGAEGTGIGLSFAEDGVDLLPNHQRGIAYAPIEMGTIVSTILKPVMVRHIPAGLHHWTLRIRHENSLDCPDRPLSYCRTRRVAPLELSVIEL